MAKEQTQNKSNIAQPRDGLAGLLDDTVIKTAQKRKKEQVEEALQAGVTPEEILHKQFAPIPQTQPSDINAMLTGQQQAQQGGGMGSILEQIGKFLVQPGGVDQQGAVQPSSILGGLIRQTPADVLRLQQAQSAATKEKNKTKPIISFNKKTGQMEVLGQVPANADVRNIDVGQDETKDVFSFDPKTGKLAKVGDVPKSAEVRNLQDKFNTEGLTSEQQTAGYALARELAGVRGAKNIFPTIITALKEGKTIDTIRDNLRFMQQSKGFSGPIRGAAQQLMAGKSDKISGRTFDYLDDLASKGNPEKVKSFLKRMAVKNASSTDESKQVMGKERTVGFLDEIKGDLKRLEDAGIDTNILSGTWEDMKSKIGQVQEPELRKVATKIRLAVMKFRRSMTGVQFGMKEHAEYEKIFPGINRTGEFNLATLSALEETFTGDLDTFYSLSMGDDNYREIFKGEVDGEYQKYLKAIGG